MLLRGFWLTLMLLPSLATAEVMVLVQGYLGEGDPWRRSGVVSVLQRGGWQDAGHLFDGPGGVVRQGPTASSAKRLYTLSLPTEAPLLVQAGHLKHYMGYLQTRHGGESLYLVGHSAGGVLARLYMVQHPDVRVAALITIASPHLGTGTAEAGFLAGQSPLGWFAPLMGAEELNRSQGLFHDLGREQGGNLLFWLNRQPHPKSRYISVIRKNGGWFGMGDMVVPDWSQDMNNIPALRGSVVRWPVPTDHPLAASDGGVLLEIMRRLQSS